MTSPFAWKSAPSAIGTDLQREATTSARRVAGIHGYHARVIAQTGRHPGTLTLTPPLLDRGGWDYGQGRKR